MVYSDPNEFTAYEPEFSEPVHMDLKRWSEEALEILAREDSSQPDNLPLFEKYQFFTPGEFFFFFFVHVRTPTIMVC